MLRQGPGRHRRLSLVSIPPLPFTTSLLHRSAASSRFCRALLPSPFPIKMADIPDPPEAANIKGFAKYYNSVTEKGRAGAAKITLAGLGLFILYLKFKPSKPAK